MRKRLNFATGESLGHLKLQLDYVAAETCLKLIHSKLKEYYHVIRREPKGIALPVAIYLVLVRHQEHFHEHMRIDPERRSTLFGLQVEPICGDRYSFIPHDDDVVMLAMLERV